MPLTDTYIKNLKYPGKPKKYFGGGGLFLFLFASGKKLWRMAYRFDEKPKTLSFGEYPTITLKDARERREEAKKMLANGIDPGQQKKAAKAEQLSEIQDTFRSIALEWHNTRTVDFTEKHRGTVIGTALRSTYFRLSAMNTSPEWKPRTSWPWSGPSSKRGRTKSLRQGIGGRQQNLD